MVECESEVIREQMKGAAGLEQHKHMRETLARLTHLDYNGAQLISSIGRRVSTFPIGVSVVRLTGPSILGGR